MKDKLYELALKVKQACNKWFETEKDWGNILYSEKTKKAFNEYEDAEHELLNFIYNEL